MKSSCALSQRPGRAGLMLLFLLSVLFPATLHAAESAPPPRSFLGQVADFTTSVHDHPLYSGAGNAVESYLEYQTVLQGAIDTGKAIDSYANYQEAIQGAIDEAGNLDALKSVGKYAKILDYGLKAIKFGDLGLQGYEALRAGDREGFRTVFNTVMKEVVKTVAGKAGSAKGGAIGGKAGFALGAFAGGWGAVPGAATGGFAGSWIGDYIATTSVEFLYDRVLEEHVSVLADYIFDATAQEGAGMSVAPRETKATQNEESPPLILPPVNPPSISPPGSSGGGRGAPELKPFR